jgi:hypothetical protein
MGAVASLLLDLKRRLRVLRNGRTPEACMVLSPDPYVNDVNAQ